MKRKIILSLTIMLAIPAMGIKNVEAVDFEQNEEKYIQICASGSLSESDEAVCKEFNAYLKEKNANLKNEITDNQNAAEETQDSIESLTGDINKVESDISEKENEIQYLETSITNLEESIAKKEDELKERMYTMQTYSNSRALIDFIFSASDFTDLLSRVASLNEITAYDNQLIDELASEKAEFENQQATLVTAKEILEQQKIELTNKKATLLALYQEQNAAVLAAKKAQLEASQTQQKVDDNLAALAWAAEQSRLAALEEQRKAEAEANLNTGDMSTGQKIAALALTKLGLWYVWGGCHTMAEVINYNSTRFDCSGLVNWSYYHAGVNIGVQYTGSLVTMGQSISKGNIQTGDIILFSRDGTRSGVHHVGIYIGNNQMVHAPYTGAQIQIANLNNAYWQAEWYTVRRIY